VSRTGRPGPLAQPRDAERPFWFWLAGILALAVAIRVPYTLLVAPWPPLIFNDEAYYSTLANLIADGQGFVRPGEALGEGISVPTAERAPLYPFTLAGLAELGVTGADSRRLLGTLTGAGVVLTLGLLGRRLAGPRAGLFAAGLAALYPTLIAADGALMTESLYGFLAALSLLAAYRLVDSPSVGRAIVLGAPLGLAALVRAEALLLLVLLLVPLIRHRARWRAAIAVCLAFGVVLAPWTIRNWSVFDRPVLVATEGGETLAGANCRDSYYGDRIGAWTVDCLHFSGRGNEAVELNEEGRRGIRYALDHLQRVPVVLAVRLARTWGVYSPFQVPEGRERWVMNMGAVIFFLLVPPAIYGFVLLRRRGVAVWILVSPFVTVTLTTLLSYGSVRFRHSAELPLVVLAAVALDRLASRGLDRVSSSRKVRPVHG
jgi:4-amino-4-deoxy-L-arabinose transferase-like glycosyltransferase